MSTDIVKVITLSPVEAQAGVTLRLNNLVEKKCPACRGEGERLVRLSNTMRDAITCEDCSGIGIICTTETIEVEIGRFDVDQKKRKYIYEGLGSYSDSLDTRGDLIIQVNVDRICVEDEDRDFTVLSYGYLDNFDEKFEEEQQNFYEERNNNAHSLADNFEQKSLFDDFEDEEDDFISDDELEDVSLNVYNPLMQMASPELYEKNAFRLLGMVPGISEREAKRNIDKIQKLRRLGVVATNSESFLPIHNVSEEEIDLAGQVILNAEKRFLHEFFWILPANLFGDSEDQEFIVALQKGDVGLSMDILSEEIYSYTFRTPSVPKYLPNRDPLGYKLHNAAILCHILALNGAESWENCYWWWENLIDNVSFWKFLEEKRVSEIDNPLVRVSTVRQIRNNLPRFLLTINADLAVRYAEKGEEELALEQVGLVRNQFAEENLGLEILLDIVQPKKEQIEHLIDQFEFETNRTESGTNLIIKKFLEKCEKLIKILIILLGEDHPSTLNLGTKITRSARNATIDYGKETKDWRECISINSILLQFPCDSNLAKRVVEDQETFATQLIKGEIEVLCDKALQACDKDILQTPAIVSNFLLGSQKLVESLQLDFITTVNWGDPIVHLARSLMVEYANETENWHECLALQSRFEAFPCSPELREQLVKDEKSLSEQIHRKEITDLLDQALKSSDSGFPPVPLIVKDLLTKCRRILDKKSNELGTDNQIVQELKELVYRVCNGLLIKYVNEKEDFARTLEVLKMLKPFAVTSEQKQQLEQDIVTLQNNDDLYKKTIRCWFCMENKGNDSSAIKVPMHGNVVRNYVFNRTEVTWRNAEVTVPRCLSCEDAHLRKSKFITSGAIIGMLFGTLINLPLLSYGDRVDPGVLLFLGGFLGILVVSGSIWLGYDIAKEIDRVTQKRQTYDLQTKYQHPQILELQRRGWAIGDRPSV